MIIPMWTAKQIKALRERYGESQPIFAQKRLGVSPDTLRYWEQGRGVPSGPAAILLDRLQEDADRGEIRPLSPQLQTA